MKEGVRPGQSDPTGQGVRHIDPVTGRPLLDFILRFLRFLFALLGHGGGPVAR